MVNGGPEKRHWEKKTPEEMDDEAAKAREEFRTLGLDLETMEKLSAWWDKWYLTAGHKRLGRILTKGL